MEIKTFIDEEKLKERINELADEISKDFENEKIVILGILNGSFMFCSDLVRKISCPMWVDFLSVKSYEGTESTGEVNVLLDTKIDLENKNVLIVEDIVDTGLTLKNLRALLEKRNPKKLMLASLLHKPSKNKFKTPIDYLGFEIEDKFVVGYGLDLDGRFRELPYIGVVSD